MTATAPARDRVLMEGSEALARAAIVAGCRFFAGYPMTPFTEVFTGHENTSPSGMLRVPSHFFAPMPLMLKLRSVPGPFRCTRSVLAINFCSGPMARAIFTESSASAIAAQGLLRLGHLLNAELYTSAGLTIAPGASGMARWGSRKNAKSQIKTAATIAKLIHLKISLARSVGEPPPSSAA